MIIDPTLLIIFIPAALALNLTPGADMLFCLAQGLRGAGAKSAIAASLGISVGGMINVALAGLGLGTIVANAPWLFNIIRLSGAVYLLFLAIQTLRHKVNPNISGQRLSPARAFRNGLIVNLTNPKVILFVLAFIPQFITPENGHILGQFLIFGSVLAIGGFVINGAVGLFARSIGSVLIKRPVWERMLRWVSATVLAALALKLLKDARL